MLFENTPRLKITNLKLKVHGLMFKIPAGTPLDVYQLLGDNLLLWLLHYPRLQQ